MREILAIVLTVLLVGGTVAVANPATAQQESIEVSIQPANGEQTGDEQTYELVVTGASNGVGAYSALISVPTQDDIEITDLQAFDTVDGLFEKEFSDRGRSVELAGLVDHDPESEVVLARFDVDTSGVDGEATLNLTVNELTDKEGHEYTIESAAGAAVTNSGGDEGSESNSGDDESTETSNGDDESTESNGGDDKNRNGESTETNTGKEGNTGDQKRHVPTFPADMLIELLIERLPV